MKRRTGGCLILVIVLVVVGTVLALFAWWRVDDARVQNDVPTVMLTEPLPGALVQAGSALTVAATAHGRTPIRQVELWIDGELKGVQSSSTPTGTSPLYARFQTDLLEGPHQLTVRAVNMAGTIGQSVPLDVAVQFKPPPGQTFRLIKAHAGASVAEIAQANGTTRETIHTLNPQLQGKDPVIDTSITVPLPPDGAITDAGKPITVNPDAPGQQPPDVVGPPPPPSPPPGSGQVQTPPGLPLKPIPPADIVGINPGIVIGILSLKPPAAPTALQAQVSNCKVKLVWNDNADNEWRYDVWMSGLTFPPRVIASLEPAAGGPAWFEFSAPGPGLFSFWVEAVNIMTGQASNVAPVLVPNTCPNTLATSLLVEWMDVKAPGNIERFYCYASYEGVPEIRLPEGSNWFIPLSGGNGDFRSAAPGPGAPPLPPPPAGVMTVTVSASLGYSLPIPADGAMDISGECWGWSGPTLSKLGNFSSKFASDEWDGARRVIQGQGYQIGIAIKPSGAMGTSTYETYGYQDPSLPVPYDVKEYGYRSPFPLADPLLRSVDWKWSGDPSKIKGFAIYLNGAKVKVVNDSSARSADVRLPKDCGMNIRWQVTALAGNAESKLSAPYEYEQLPCEAYIAVRFDSIYFTWTQDGWFGDCDTMDAYYTIWVNATSKSFWGGNFFYPVRCGVNYSFKDLAWYSNDPYRDQIVVAIDPKESVVFLIGVMFHDYDTLSSNDMMAFHADDFHMGTFQEAQQTVGCGMSFTTPRRAKSEGSSFAKYTITIYPNICGTQPPYKP